MAGNGSVGWQRVSPMLTAHRERAGAALRATRVTRCSGEEGAQAVSVRGGGGGLPAAKSAVTRVRWRGHLTQASSSQPIVASAFVTRPELRAGPGLSRDGRRRHRDGVTAANGRA
jgi:hypothetical protein